MKLSRLFWAVALVLAAMSVGVAKADGVPPGDPLIKAAGAGFDAPAAVITQNFTISSADGNSPSSTPCVLSQPAGSVSPIVTTSPNCQFLNVITENGVGQDINALIFELPSVATNTVNCSTDITGATSLFGGCSAASDGGNGTVVTFFGGAGITYGSIFSLEFDGFTGGLTSTVYANVAEPATLLLLAIGLVALVGLGRKQVLSRAV